MHHTGMILLCKRIGLLCKKDPLFVLWTNYGQMAIMYGHLYFSDNNWQLSKRRPCSKMTFNATDNPPNCHGRIANVFDFIIVQSDEQAVQIAEAITPQEL